MMVKLILSDDCVICLLWAFPGLMMVILPSYNSKHKTFFTGVDAFPYHLYLSFCGCDGRAVAGKHRESIVGVLWLVLMFTVAGDCFMCCCWL